MSMPLHTSQATPRRPESTSDADLGEEFVLLRRQIAAAEAGEAPPLPGHARFLPNDRVLCRPRKRGDSRYPYGRDGLHFWVHASGYMYGNQGPYFALLPFHPGHEPRVAFFVGQQQADGAYRPVSLLPVPHISASADDVRERFTVFGRDAAYFGVRTDELFGGLRVFVDQSAAERIDIVFSLLLANESDETLSLHASSFINPFCRHQFAESAEDVWFKRVEVWAPPSNDERVSGCMPASHLIAVNEDVDRFQSVTNHACVRRATTLAAAESETCTSRRVFLGSPLFDLGQAASLTQGRFAEPTPVTTFNDVAIAADLQRFRLRPGNVARFDYVFSLLSRETEPRRLLTSAPTPGAIDAALHAQRTKSGRSRGFALEVRQSTSDAFSAVTFNRFLPFLREQVRVCAEISGHLQPVPNSLIGIRDVFQAIEGYLYERPGFARRKILEALEYVLVDGRCPRQYSLPANGKPGPADLREYIDQGSWVVAAVYTYLCVTGDWSLLRETTGYHELVPGQWNAVRPAERRDTVLEHLLRIMGYLERQRDPGTGLLRILYGDWNDAVDGLGAPLEPGPEYGSGVSVMASLHFYQNCRELVELLRELDPVVHARRVAAYAELAGELHDGLLRHAVVTRGDEQRIVHGWGDARGYFVGSFCDSDGEARDSLTSNAFWVLSGMLAQAPALGPVIRAAFTRLDSRFGLRTFTPGFAPEAPGVGRVRRLPLGTAENGAAYLHATLFGAWAQFEMGAAEEAWQQIEKVLPFSPQHAALSHSPFVLPNSYVDNADLGLTGQSMNDWQTGSSNVLLKLLVRCVCGFRPGLRGLEIAPADRGPLSTFEFSARAHGKPVRIRYRRGAVIHREVRLAGRPLRTQRDLLRAVDVVRIPYERLSDEQNTFDIVDPAAG